MNLSPPLITGLHQYFQNSGAQKAIVGVSGGVDSAVTLSIAVRALGHSRVIPVLMPFQIGKISSHENFEDAKNICALFHTTPRIFQLDDFFAPYEQNMPEMAQQMVTGNTLARIRMTILFALANAENGLVLGTCNKTEVLLGYETKFGDGAADISVLGDLWKTEVWEMAKELDLPEIFITKTPSAELFEGHTDEGELGFSYIQADNILQALENGEELEKTPTLERIQMLIKKSEHKRISIPVLPKSV
ncbi:MAG: NAD(+) synthase [Candidatus Peregrinibacteria bacterium]